MAASEETCDGNPNFAVICSFIAKFGDDCGVNIAIPYLQQMLEDTKNVNEDLKELHIHLLRRGRKRVNKEKWERSLIKFCHEYSSVDAWELERFGYKKAKLSVKLELLKRLLELQFDNNSKFKGEVNKQDAQLLRILPMGRDIDGQTYWYQLDKEHNMRLYRESCGDESVWQLLCSTTDHLKELLQTLEKKYPNSKGEECKEEISLTCPTEDIKEEIVPKREIENEDLKACISETKPCTIIIKSEKKELPSTNLQTVNDAKSNGDLAVLNLEAPTENATENQLVDSDKTLLGATDEPLKELNEKQDNQENSVNDSNLTEIKSHSEEPAIGDAKVGNSEKLDQNEMEVDPPNLVDNTKVSTIKNAVESDVPVPDKEDEETAIIKNNLSSNTLQPSITQEKTDTITKFKGSKIKLYEKWSNEKKKLAEASVEDCKQNSSFSLSTHKEHKKSDQHSPDVEMSSAVPMISPSEKLKLYKPIDMLSTQKDQKIEPQDEIPMDLSLPNRSTDLIVQSACVPTSESTASFHRNENASVVPSNFSKDSFLMAGNGKPKDSPSGKPIKKGIDSSFSSDLPSELSQPFKKKRLSMAKEEAVKESHEHMRKSVIFEVKNNKLLNQYQQLPSEESGVSSDRTCSGLSHLQALQNMCDNSPMAGMQNSVIQPTNCDKVAKNDFRSNKLGNKATNSAFFDSRYDISEKYSFSGVQFSSDKIVSNEYEATNTLLKSNILSSSKIAAKEGSEKTVKSEGKIEGIIQNLKHSQVSIQNDKAEKPVKGNNHHVNETKMSISEDFDLKADKSKAKFSSDQSVQLVSETSVAEKTDKIPSAKAHVNHDHNKAVVINGNNTSSENDSSNSSAKTSHQRCLDVSSKTEDKVTLSGDCSPSVNEKSSSLNIEKEKSVALESCKKNLSGNNASVSGSSDNKAADLTPKCSADVKVSKDNINDSIENLRSDISSDAVQINSDHLLIKKSVDENSNSVLQNAESTGEISEKESESFNIEKNSSKELDIELSTTQLKVVTDVDVKISQPEFIEGKENIEDPQKEKLNLISDCNDVICPLTKNDSAKLLSDDIKNLIGKTEDEMEKKLEGTNSEGADGKTPDSAVTCSRSCEIKADVANSSTAVQENKNDRNDLESNDVGFKTENEVTVDKKICSAEKKCEKNEKRINLDEKIKKVNVESGSKSSIAEAQNAKANESQETSITSEKDDSDINTSKKNEDTPLNTRVETSLPEVQSLSKNVDPNAIKNDLHSDETNKEIITPESETKKICSSDELKEGDNLIEKSVDGDMHSKSVLQDDQNEKSEQDSAINWEEHVQCKDSKLLVSDPKDKKKGCDLKDKPEFDNISDTKVLKKEKMKAKNNLDAKDESTSDCEGKKREDTDKKLLLEKSIDLNNRSEITNFEESLKLDSKEQSATQNDEIIEPKKEEPIKSDLNSSSNEIETAKVECMETIESDSKINLNCLNETSESETNATVCKEKVESSDFGSTSDPKRNNAADIHPVVSEQCATDNASTTVVSDTKLISCIDPDSVSVSKQAENVESEQKDSRNDSAVIDNDDTSKPSEQTKTDDVEVPDVVQPDLKENQLDEGNDNCNLDKTKLSPETNSVQTLNKTNKRNARGKKGARKRGSSARKVKDEQSAQNIIDCHVSKNQMPSIVLKKLDTFENGEAEELGDKICKENLLKSDKVNKDVSSSEKVAQISFTPKKVSPKDAFGVYYVMTSLCLETKFKHPSLNRDATKSVESDSNVKPNLISSFSLDTTNDELVIIDCVQGSRGRKKRGRLRQRIAPRRKQPPPSRPIEVKVPEPEPEVVPVKVGPRSQRRRGQKESRKALVEKDDFTIPEGFLEILGNTQSEKKEPARKSRGRKSKAASTSLQSSESESTPIKRSRRIQEQHQKKMSELAVEMEREQRMLEQLAKKTTAKKIAAAPKVPPPKPTEVKTPRGRKPKFQPPAPEEETCMGTKRATRKMNSRSRNMTKMTLMYEDESKDSEFSTSRETDKSKKRRKRGNKRGFRPWDVSSESSSSIEELTEEEEEEHEEPLIFDVNEDEFACEEIDEDAEPVIVRRARTAKKTNEPTEGETEEVVNDDKPCSKCGKYDRPEWILLCDKCDNGYHTTCLVPPLMIVPDGDWFCQPCEHLYLCECLEKELHKLELVLKQKEREELRKQRLAYVGISLDNVLKPEKKEKSDESSKEDAAENEAESKEEKTRRESSEDERHNKLYGKRSVRARRTVNYQFKEYDELIASAIEEEMLGVKLAEGAFEDDDKGNDSDKPFTAKVSKRRKRSSRLNDLDFSDTEEDSGEEYKGLSSDSEHTARPSSNDSDPESAASGEWRIVKTRGKPQRRQRRRRRDSSDEEWEEEEASDSYRPATRRAAQKNISYRELSSDDDEEWGDVKPQTIEKRKKFASSGDSETSFKEKKPKKKARVRKWASSDSESDKSMTSSEESESSQEESEDQWKIKKSCDGNRIRLNKKVLSSENESTSQDSLPKKQVKKIVSDSEEEEEEDDDDDDDDDEEEEDEEEEEDDDEDEEEESSSDENKQESEAECDASKQANKSKKPPETELVQPAASKPPEPQKPVKKEDSLNVVVPPEPIKGKNTVVTVKDKAPLRTVKKEATKMVPCVIPYDKSPKSGHGTTPDEESDKEIPKEKENPRTALPVRPANNLQTNPPTANNVNNTVVQSSKPASDCKSFKSTIMEPFSTMDEEIDSDDEVPLERIPTACVPNPHPNKPVVYEREIEYTPAKELSNISYAAPEEKCFPSSYSSLAPFQDYSSRPSPLKPSLVETYPNNSSPSKLTPLDTYSQTSSPKGFISLDSYTEARKKKNFYGNPSVEPEVVPRSMPTSSDSYQGEIRFPPEPYPCPPSPNSYSHRSPPHVQRDPGTPPRLYSQFPDAYAPPRSPEYYQNHQYYASEERIPRPSYQPNYAPPEQVPPYISNPYVATPVPQPNGGFMIDTLLRARNPDNEEDELTGVTDIVSYITQE